MFPVSSCEKPPGVSLKGLEAKQPRRAQGHFCKGNPTCWKLVKFVCFWCAAERRRWGYLAHAVDYTSIGKRVYISSHFLLCWIFIHLLTYLKLKKKGSLSAAIHIIVVEETGNNQRIIPKTMRECWKRLALWVCRTGRGPQGMYCGCVWIQMWKEVGDKKDPCVYQLFFK